MNGELVDDDKQCGAGHGIVTPFHTLICAESGEQTSQDHDDVSNDRDQDVGTAQAGKEAKIHEQEWGGDAPVDVSGPVD